MLKKILFSLTLIACTFTQIDAQSRAEKVFKTYRFGIYTGPTFNSLRPVANEAKGYIVSKVKGNVGFSLGLTADYNINDRYTIFSGVSLDWRGGTISVRDKDTIVDVDYIFKNEVKYKQQYLTIPIGLKMKAAQFDKIKVYAQTGIDVGFLLSQKGNISTVYNYYSGVVPISLEKVKLGQIARSTPISAGWMLGVGGEYEITDKNSAYLTILYRNGFTDATVPQSNTAGHKFNDGNIRSNTIAIRVGYYF
ncbi:MAG TPA: porin family protein [Chitinophagaceae bacterium]|nr:porin family protein [Chitinophagaceae bacterium]